MPMKNITLRTNLSAEGKEPSQKARVGEILHRHDQANTLGGNAVRGRGGVNWHVRMFKSANSDGVLNYFLV